MTKNIKWKKIVWRIVIALFSIVFILLIFFVYRFTKPKTDEIVFEKFENEIYQPFISKVHYKDHIVRVISMQEQLDLTLPVLVFIHGSPGSSMDFKQYLTNDELNSNANIITYDRVGYGYHSDEKVLGNLESELEVLQKVIPVKDLQKVILIGYSYGGTIVAASPKNYKSKILLAPAIKGELEPMFWMLNLYKWKITKPLVPNVFQNAAMEKMEHLTELPLYKNKWNISRSPLVVVHGDKDRIVPYENSLFLKKIFDHRQFELITIPDGNHGLVWNHFDLIKSEILKEIRK